jgi:hypothetical protein
MRFSFRFPALIFYVNKVQKGKGYVVRGKTIGPVVIIGTSYEKDRGLLEHEIEHVRQFWTHGLFIHSYLYLIRKYRLWCECMAYYKQWLFSERTEEKKADFRDRIWLFYNLKYSREYVEKKFYSFFPKET